MKKLNKILTFIMVLSVLIFYNPIESKAAGSVSIALSSSSISMGGSVSATVSVSGSDVSAYDIYVSYDASVLQFNSGSGSAQANGGGGTIRLVGTGAGSTTLSFTAIGNGSCYISTSGTECYDINYNQISISHAGASVTVATSSNNNQNNNNNNQDDDKKTTEDDGRSSNCNLKSLQISPGTLEPAFSPSTTSYSVQVDEDVTSMVVSAVAEDEKATTAVKGAGLIEPGANTVTVTVTAENGAVKVYTLSVAAGEVLGDAKATIDGKEYSFVQSSKGLEIPEGYNEITTTYKDWEVLAFESPNKKIVLVCLEKTPEENDASVDADETALEWFIYDKDKESFIPYREYSSEFNRYVITEAPEGVEIPEGFEKTELDLGGIGEKVVVYKSNDIKDSNIYLVYAINIAGDEGFYWYDKKEKAFLRYVETEKPEIKEEVATETIATPVEPVVVEKPVSNDDGGFFTKKTLGIICVGLGILTFLLIITIITLIVILRSKDEYDEDDIEDEETFDEDVDEKYAKRSKKSKESEMIFEPETEKEKKRNKADHEETVYEEERKAYEEDRDVNDNKDEASKSDINKVLPVAKDRNIQIMNFKKKDNEEAERKTEEAKAEVEAFNEEIKEEIKETGEETSGEIETIKFDFPDNYDAEKDSAFTDDSNK